MMALIVFMYEVSILHANFRIHVLWRQLFKISFLTFMCYLDWNLDKAVEGNFVNIRQHRRREILARVHLSRNETVLAHAQCHCCHVRFLILDYFETEKNGEGSIALEFKRPTPTLNFNNSFPSPSDGFD